MTMTKLRVVKAIYPFEGQNNDELKLRRGDRILVTQAPDGGWWEGTLGTVTGWFPSNYVQEITDPKIIEKFAAGAAERTEEHYNMVLYHLMETEDEYMADLSGILQRIVAVLENAPSGRISENDLRLVRSNLPDILSFHETLVEEMRENISNSVQERRPAGILMLHAAEVQVLYETFSKQHPVAVSVLQRHADLLTTSNDSLSNGSNSVAQHSPSSSRNGGRDDAETKVKLYSQPLRRLKLYPTQLKELERHMPLDHPDRGDAQRAVELYDEILAECNEVRRLKELQLEVFSSAIQHLDRPLRSYGEPVRLGDLYQLTNKGERLERLLVLYPGLLFILAYDHQGAFVCQGKVLLNGLHVAAATESAASDGGDADERPSNAFEITGPMSHLVFYCRRVRDRKLWLDDLNKQRQLPPPSGVISTGLSSTPTASTSKRHTNTLPNRPAVNGSSSQRSSSHASTPSPSTVLRSGSGTLSRGATPNKQTSPLVNGYRSASSMQPLSDLVPSAEAATLAPAGTGGGSVVFQSPQYAMPASSLSGPVYASVPIATADVPQDATLNMVYRNRSRRGPSTSGANTPDGGHMGAASSPPSGHLTGSMSSSSSRLISAGPANSSLSSTTVVAGGRRQSGLAQQAGQRGYFTLRPSVPIRYAAGVSADQVLGGTCQHDPSPSSGSSGLLRLGKMARGVGGSLKRKSEEAKSTEDDEAIMQVLETYTNYGSAVSQLKARHSAKTGSSSSVAPTNSDVPTILVPEQEKIITEVERDDGTTFLEDRSLVDVVYDVEGSVRAMKLQIQRLQATLERERNERKRLENTFRDFLKKWDNPDVYEADG